MRDRIICAAKTILALRDRGDPIPPNVIDMLSGVGVRVPDGMSAQSLLYDLDLHFPGVRENVHAGYCQGQQRK